jgi:ClpP class serine protease
LDQQGKSVIGIPISVRKEILMKIETKEYMIIERRQEIAEKVRKLRKLRRQFLRYKEAEVVYSIQRKKLIELADEAGAIYKVDGYVLINRDIFDEYFEQFHGKA